MNNIPPFFSVVMPTYNRARLLPLAIQSVLNQSFTDFEIVVSNGGSTDDTSEVVGQFDDSRIRYLESKERLSIGDNYQNGLDHASGEYITFLGDDDAFVPTMFERVKRVIDERAAPIVAFRVSRYYHDDDTELDLLSPIAANTLAVPQFTNELTEFEQSQAIKVLFHNYNLISDGAANPKFITPYLANAVYHHKVFSSLSRKSQKLFATTPADMYLAAAVFFASDSYYCLDEPLHVWSHWAGNSTASPHRKGSKLREHYEKLLNGSELDYTPLKFALPQNLYANALLQAKHDFASETKSDFEIDWANYYVSVYDDLMNLKSKGVEVSREVIEFNRILSEQTADLQKIVRAETSNARFIAKQFVRTKMPFAKNFIKKVLRGKTASGQTLISGEEAGFKTFLEAAQFLNEKMLPELVAERNVSGMGA